MTLNQVYEMLFLPRGVYSGWDIVVTVLYVCTYIRTYVQIFRCVCKTVDVVYFLGDSFNFLISWYIFYSLFEVSDII